MKAGAIGLMQRRHPCLTRLRISAIIADGESAPERLPVGLDHSIRCCPSSGPLPKKNVCHRPRNQNSIRAQIPRSTPARGLQLYCTLLSESSTPGRVPSGQ